MDSESEVRTGGPKRTPTNERTYERTHGEGFSPTSETSSSWTRTRAYEILPARFISKVDFQECWVWTACTDRTGYGLFSINSNRNIRAHRFAYELIVGVVPEGMECDHLCRNRACVNPDHIEIVTHRENLLRIRTRVSKGESVSTHSDESRCPMGHPWAEFGSRHRDGYLRCKACASQRERLRRRARRAS